VPVPRADWPTDTHLLLTQLTLELRLMSFYQSDQIWVSLPSLAA